MTLKNEVVSVWFSRTTYDWTRVTFNDTEGRGSVIIESSFGTWGYSWLEADRDGAPLIPWFLNSEFDYIAGKMAAGDRAVDTDRSYDALRIVVLKKRRAGQVSGPVARDEYERLSQVVDDQDLSVWLGQTVLGDLYEHICYKPSPDLRLWFLTFFDRLRREAA